MEDVDNFGFAAHDSVDDAIRRLNELTNTRALIASDCTPKVGKLGELVASLQEAIYRAMCRIFRVGCDAAVDIGKGFQSTVRPPDAHRGMPSLSRISSLVQVTFASRSAIPSSTRW